MGQAIAKAAQNQGVLTGKALDYLKANRMFREGLEQNCLTQNDELQRTGSNAAASSFKKTGLHPFSCECEGWKNVFATFGKLNELLKQQQKESGEIIPETTWVVKPIDIDKRKELSEEDAALIDAFVGEDDFMFTSMEGQTNQLEVMKMPRLFVGAAVAERLLGPCVHDHQKDDNEPPEASNDIEKAALKFVEHVGLKACDRVDTTCTLPEKEMQKDKLITRLSLLRGGDSIILSKKGNASKNATVTKRGINRFIIFDGDQRLSTNFGKMPTAQTLENCVCNQQHEGELTAEDKKKRRRKNRVARKQQNKTLGELATAIAIGDQKQHRRRTRKKMRPGSRWQSPQLKKPHNLQTVCPFKCFLRHVRLRVMDTIAGTHLGNQKNKTGKVPCRF